ncbi:asparaginase [Candidatus Poribacteria bacterium]|nr:asparaginase [Candidatus Poribacteria bacterium]
MHSNDTVPLIEITRGEIVETIHRGAIAVVDTQGTIQYAAGNSELTTYMRSAAKPFQLLLTIEADAIEKFNLTQAEVSVMCASHSGEDYHLEAVRSILRKIGLTEDALQCGPHLPGHTPTQREMIKRDEDPIAIHSNCSGKHTGMLTLCQIKGFPIEGYLNPTHPVQQLILQTIAEVADMESGEIGIGIDGCGVPTFALPIEKIGLLFSRLGDPSLFSSKRQNALNHIREAMMAYPKYMSGSGRFCAALMSEFPGRVVLKSGAAGVYGVGLPEHHLGIGLKIENGLGEPRYAAVLAILKQLELLPKAGLDRLWKQFCPPVRNYRKQIVGEIRPTFKLLTD